MQNCGREREKRLLLDALLQLAPGHLQVLAALADQWASSAGAKPMEGASKPFGGVNANCYMWRAGGPLLGNRS